ncbi:MAG: hypothetical protein JL50_07425 [Peptococcaceae bacterium BICA1-7]|nr:MAG: hypothetical protein JL50_07425 [Peptococcaceae bacterium BICA1-7]HBV97927.1 hypothetical protein [Desulfotomaculum sp.]
MSLFLYINSVNIRHITQNYILKRIGESRDTSISFIFTNLLITYGKFVIMTLMPYRYSTEFSTS